MRPTTPDKPTAAYTEPVPVVVLDAIGFGLADYLPQVEAGQPFSACYTLEMNEYRGFRNVQLRLLDLRWE